MIRGYLKLLVIFTALSITSRLFAIDKDSNCRVNIAMEKASVSVHGVFYNGNNISSWCKNDGMIVSHHYDGHAGMKWPGHTNKSIDYASGLCLMGMTIDNEIRSASCEYSTEFYPGFILPDGTPADPTDQSFKIYKINADGSGDWDAWPFDQGAPVLKTKLGLDSLDAFGNRIPRLYGDQTLFWVMNDANWGKHGLYNTKPMGVEVQVLIFGYNEPPLLQDVMFVQWKIINKSGNTYHSCYAGIFDDCDLGDAVDDYTGCSPELDLSYTYNSDIDDRQYNLVPPAVGNALLSGPVSKGTPLSMTSFISYT